MSAFPPQRSILSIPVSQDIALKYLQSYLTATADSPYLLPNARLEPSGPTAGSSTSSVTIHNLQRVEAGLRGEWLAPSLELQEDGPVKVARGLEDAGEGDTMQVDGWQDLGEYQREQTIEEGEVGPRQTGVAQEGDDDFEDRAEVDTELDAPKAKKAKTEHHGDVYARVAPVLDKEAKKKEKKLRVKEEKRRRKEEYMRSKEAET